MLINEKYILWQYLEASSDACVELCNYCESGVLEVKCPICADSSSLDAIAHSQPSLEPQHIYDVYLKHKHSQCQLPLCAADIDLHFERITRDDEFLQENNFIL